MYVIRGSMADGNTENDLYGDEHVQRVLDRVRKVYGQVPLVSEVLSKRPDMFIPYSDLSSAVLFKPKFMDQKAMELAAIAAGSALGAEYCLMVHFKQAAELGVRGLRNRYRWPGIGAPLTAGIEPVAGLSNTAYSLVDPDVKVPVTMFLRLENLEEGLKSGTVRGHLELHTTEASTSVTINGRQVPLEFEMSSALAHTLEGSAMYKLELKGLLSGDFSLPIKNVSRFRDDVLLLSPYQPGRIPVVFVHGTASSPARWAEMLNELQNDPDLWGTVSVLAVYLQLRKPRCLFRRHSV